MSDENFAMTNSEIVKKILSLETAFRIVFPNISVSSIAAGLPIFLSVSLPDSASVPSSGRKNIGHKETHTSKITHERDKEVGEGEDRQKCTIEVIVNVEYTPTRDLSERNEQGIVTKYCYEYDIKIIVTVEEVCVGTRTLKGTSTHTLPPKVICDGDSTDRPTTENTTGFDGSVTDTLTYPHGTKVTTKTNGNTTTVTVTYPDGVTETLTISD